MKNPVLIVIFLFIFICVSNAQQLESMKYHKHRGTLKNSLQKFETSKKARVVFLGGSHTFNPGWRDSICNYLQQKFPETEYDFINAGVPSLGSTSAAFRFERDVLENGPVDLLFIDTAYDDDNNCLSSNEINRAMEGIIRHAKTANPFCDLILIHFFDRGMLENDGTSKIREVIQLQNKVAEYYHVSSINLAKEINERIDAEEFTLENLLGNNLLPPVIQEVYFASIKTFLDAAWNPELMSDVLGTELLPLPLDKANYEHGNLIAPFTRQNIKGWRIIDNWTPDEKDRILFTSTNGSTLIGDYPGRIIKFHFEGNAVGIAIAEGPYAGIIEYSIDNSDWKKQDLAAHWNKELFRPWYYTLESGLKDKKHTLQLRVLEEKNPKSSGSKCVLRYFYYNAF